MHNLKGIICRTAAYKDGSTLYAVKFFVLGWCCDLLLDGLGFYLYTQFTCQMILAAGQEPADGCFPYFGFSFFLADVKYLVKII